MSNESKRMEKPEFLTPTQRRNLIEKLEFLHELDEICVPVRIEVLALAEEAVRLVQPPIAGFVTTLVPLARGMAHEASKLAAHRIIAIDVRR